MLWWCYWCMILTPWVSSTARLQRQKPSYLVFVGQIVVILVAVYNLVFLDPGFSLTPLWSLVHISGLILLGKQIGLFFRGQKPVQFWQFSHRNKKRGNQFNYIFFGERRGLEIVCICWLSCQKSWAGNQKIRAPVKGLYLQLVASTKRRNKQVNPARSTNVNGNNRSRSNHL